MMGLRILPFNLFRACSGAGHLVRGMLVSTHTVRIDLHPPFVNTGDFCSYPGGSDGLRPPAGRDQSPYLPPILLNGGKGNV